MLQSPVVKSDKKQAVLDAVLGGKLGELTADTKILVAKGREGLVVDRSQRANGSCVCFATSRKRSSPRRCC